VTRIKICGITNREDARAAIDYGADALGFIFVPESPRFVGDSPNLRHILESVPPFVSRVAVCLEPSQITGAVADGFEAVQFYSPDGNTSGCLDKHLLQAFRIKDASSLDEIAAAIRNGGQQLSALLLDTYHKDKLGGSGETFNWEIAREAKARFALPLILAGGLTPENVADAVAAVRPYAVDVSSGVEAEPGRKDHAKLRAFIQAVRRADSLQT
jgi:phosphoribosylanthranilate isomerase